MKKLVILFFLVLLISGCGYTGEYKEYINDTKIEELIKEREKDSQFKIIGQVKIPSSFGHIYSDLLEDTVTKCQYLSKVSENAFLTPYYDINGEVKGCGS
ncbi:MULTISPECIES: hypothetical protein [unclassified Psychrobacillus]|uniref:hypothetical protein n=1 Tax=unclassified Psychrobacillus TaxID=2636677 RepID=UPI0030F664CC